MKPAVSLLLKNTDKSLVHTSELLMLSPTGSYVQ